MTMPNVHDIIREVLKYPSIGDFQESWNLGAALKIDGVIGPKTTAAAHESYARHQAGRGDISEHFSAHEFACHCSACGHSVIVTRATLRAAERLRAVLGTVTVVSGYRCPAHNAAIGGADKSQHMHGRAIDIPGSHTVSQVRSTHSFTALGYNSKGHVIHVDTRPGYSVQEPLVFRDGE